MATKKSSTKIQGSLRFGPHEGYQGLATYDAEVGFFHGEVIGLRDVVTFQGGTPEELATAFTDSVDDYLEFCKQRGEDPEKPFSGKFVTRLPPVLHKKLNQAAQLRGQSLNGFVVTVLRKAVSPRSDRRQLRRSAKRAERKTRFSTPTKFTDVKVAAKKK